MPCDPVKLPGGTSAIVCSRGRRPIRCVTCGQPGNLLCDYPVTRDGRSTTCDRPCCKQHAVQVGKGLHHCMAHANFNKQSGSER